MTRPAVAGATTDGPVFCGPAPETEAGIGALTLSGFLSEVAAAHADREAIAFHEPDGRSVVRWTYRQLEAEATRVARGLLAAGVGKGTRVALLMGNRPQWVATAYGVALAGGVLVPLNTFFERPELAYVLEHCDASVLILQQELRGHRYADQLRELCPRLPSPDFPFLRNVVCWGTPSWEDLLAAGDDVPVEVMRAGAAAISPFDDALVIYTSGTTGRPKGVLHAHRPPALQSWRFAQQLRLDPGVRVWSAFPFFWTAGFAMVMGGTLAAGGCLVLQESFEPAEALRLLEEERVTTPHAWAHQLAQLEDHPDWPRRDLSTIRQTEAFTSFGRHPSVQVEDAWSPRAAYGLTETFTIVSSMPADTRSEEREGHQGVILPGARIRIVDPATGAPQPAGAAGEIAVAGTTLMSGYVKVAPEDTFDAEGFFRTGDAGWVDDRSRLHWTGRTNDLIKTGGANVSPVEIETELLHHPELKAALAVGLPDELLGQLVVVCAVAHDGSTVTEEDVREFLRGRIASYKIPARVLFFDDAQLSLTGNAKIRAEELRALAADRLAATASGA